MKEAAQLLSEFPQRSTNTPPPPEASRRLPECEPAAVQKCSLSFLSARRGRRPGRGRGRELPGRRRARPRRWPRAPGLSARAPHGSGGRHAGSTPLWAGGRQRHRAGGWDRGGTASAGAGAGEPWWRHPVPAPRRGEGPPPQG